VAANQAEVDLVVSAAGALPDLERQLSQIVRQAENGAPEVDVQASLAVQNSIAVMSTQLDQVLRGVDASDPSVDVEAALDAQTSLRNLRNDLDELTRAAARGTTDIVELEAVLDFPRSLAEVTEAVNDLVADVQRVAPEIEVEVDVDEDAEREITKTERALKFLGRTSIVTGKGLLGVGKGISQLSLAASGGANAVAALVAALQEVGPAAAVATQAILAQKLAAGTLKLAMVGVQEAIEDAFDPEISPDEFHKSLKKLAPEAALFVDEIHTMRRELKALQQGIQNRVFQDFDEVLRGLGQQLLPDVRRALNQTANTLNRMGKETAIAAFQLSKSGALGTALDGATQGLSNLEQVPGRLLTSFTLLSAGAAPAFDRITKAVDGVTQSLVEKLQRSFESGDLERAINGAIDTLVQLGSVVSNFGAGIRNIFAGLTSDGGGLFDVLEDISEAFEKLTASKEFQVILNELSLTAGTIVSTVLPLLQEAFVQLSPVIAELAPVVREFITAIGPELIPIIQELGPILVDIALILREQLPLAIDLTKAALGAVTIALQVVAVAVDLARKGSEKFAEFYRSDFVESFRLASNAALINRDTITDAILRWTASGIASVRNFQNTLNDFSSNLRGRFVDAVIESVGSAARAFQSLGAEIISVIGTLPDRLFDIGLQIVNGLTGGLRAGIGSVISAAHDIASAVPNSVKELLDIRSPSRVMFGLGEDTTDGFLLGIKSGFSEVSTLMSGLADMTTLDGSFSTRAGLQTVPLPGLQAAPAVTNVYVGNEFLARYVDGRVQAIDTRNRRVLSQGRRF